MVAWRGVSESELGKEGFCVVRDIGLASYSCCNKLPETWQFKTTEINFLTVLEARSPKSVSQGWNQDVGRTIFLLQAIEENLFSCLFQLLEAASISWLLALYHPGLCFHCHISFWFWPSCLSLMRTFVEPTRIIHDNFPSSKIFNLVISTKALLLKNKAKQNKTKTA